MNVIKRVARTMAAASIVLSPAFAIARTDSLPVGRCVNMGNNLESPIENAWAGKAITTDDFKTIAAAGFDTVRIPVRWDSHAAESAPFTIDPAYLARVKTVAGQALSAGLNVIVDSHNFNDLHANPDANRDRLAGLWMQIAKSLSDAPTSRLWFEIENEPHDKLTNANLVAIFAGALVAIRTSNRDRPVIIGGEFWSGIDSLATLTLPDDPNVVPTFHYYEPFDFTHQGAEWVNPSPPLGRAYGTTEDAARLDRDVQKVRAYIARTGKTPFMGEFGAIDKATPKDRVTFMARVTSAFGPTGIGMCAWAYTNTFPLYDHNKRQWIAGMRQAMVQK